MQDFVVELKRALQTKTESDKLVADPGDGEAEDETKQDANVEETDAAVEAAENDIRMAALESRVLRNWQSLHQMNG